MFIAKEVYKKTQNVPKRAVVEIDFYGDAPALQDKIQVLLSSAFFEESTLVNVPGRFRADAHNKTLARCLKEAYEQATSDNLIAVCRAGNGVTTVELLLLPVAYTGLQLLSDEAVEAIGREDYVRMVAYLGQRITDQYFEERSGVVLNDR
jgi:hypothetical protein